MYKHTLQINMDSHHVKIRIKELLCNEQELKRRRDLLLGLVPVGTEWQQMLTAIRPADEVAAASGHDNGADSWLCDRIVRHLSLTVGSCAFVVVHMTS